MSGVQKAAVAFLLHALKAAPDAGQIVGGVIAALQNCILFQIHSHITVQIQRPGQVDPGGKINLVVRTTVHERPLQGGGVQCMAVAHGVIRRLGYVDAAAHGCGADMDRTDVGNIYGIVRIG